MEVSDKDVRKALEQIAAHEEPEFHEDRTARMFGTILSAAIVVCAFLLGFAIGSLWRS